ncbi:MAG TPA: Grx4 family monothiol glutaredoxin [Alphaproteobacteria bacterium]|nr:Grx4 family monothiol glutaredoxin [Alphaproteobacteria bacterium]
MEPNKQIFDRIRNDIATNDVVLYLKGSAVFPQCGFSAAVVQVFNHLGVAYKDFNVMEDNELREGIKAFADWPTLPQVYVKGEFIGGCDITREMMATGELQTLLREKGVPMRSAA